METLQDRSTSNGDGPPADRPQGGKLGRIAGHTQGLFEDLREWMDLRIDLAILEVEEKVDALRNEVALGLTIAFFGFFAAFFVFTTAALGLGWLLGHPFWGFLIVSALLLAVVVTLARARPDLLPSSNLYEQIRGDGETDDSDPPIRDARATVSGDGQPDASD